MTSPRLFTPSRATALESKESHATNELNEILKLAKEYEDISKHYVEVQAKLTPLRKELNDLCPLDPGRKMLLLLALLVAAYESSTHNPVVDTLFILCGLATINYYGVQIPLGRNETRSLKIEELKKAELELSFESQYLNMQLNEPRFNCIFEFLKEDNVPPSLRRTA